MTALSELRRRLGSPDAVSWPVFWVTLSAAIVGNLVTTTSAPLGVRALTLGIGQIVLWLPLVLVGRILKRDPDRSRPLLVLGSAVVGLLMRAVTVGLLTAAFLGVQEVRWADRFVGALFNIGLSFVIATVVVSTFRERRQHITQLQSLQRDLSQSIEQLRRDYWDRNESTLAQIHAVLLDELSSMDATDAGRSLEVLQRTASDVVRPLSHRLARERGPEPREIVSVEPTVAWPVVLNEAAAGRPFRPGITTLFVGIEAMAATVAYPRGAPVFAAVVVATWIGLGVANRALIRVLTGRSLVFRVPAVVLCAALVGACVAAVVRLGVGPAPVATALTFGAFFFVTVFSLGVTLAAAFLRDREQMIGLLQESSLRLRRRVVCLQQAQWFQNKALSRALHGPIQTAVTAAALRLDAAIRAGSVPPALIDQARGQIEQALGAMGTTDVHVVSLAEAAERLSSAWEGLCGISMVASTEAQAVAADDPVLRSCIIDIVTEAVTNAVRHGKATLATIDIGLMGPHPGSQDVMVSITSDSAWVNSSGQAGLGTHLLDDCTLEWGVDHTQAGVRLWAHMPTLELVVA